MAKTQNDVRQLAKEAKAKIVDLKFAELKQHLRLGRVRLRRLWNVSEQLLLAATTRDLKPRAIPRAPATQTGS
jgi:hypothetical protein